jgi:peptidoglycan/LPS O-acetylase OafA/YrhL
MNSDNPIVVVILGLIAVVGIAWVVHHFLSVGARRERRRRRNNARISSTVNRPMVKLSARTKKERRK